MIAAFRLVSVAFASLALGLAAPAGAESAAKRYSNAKYGFSLLYPSAWTESRVSGATVVHVGEKDGLACNVRVLDGALPDDGTGKPPKLVELLGTMKAEEAERAFPPSLKARVTRVEMDELGGQAARRVDVNLVAGEGKALTLIQFQTLRSYGAVTLTCGGPSALVAEPAAQRIVQGVKEGFRFQP
jgi:hypothetical protein